MREIKFRAWDKSKNKMFYDVQETVCYWNGVFNPDVIQEDNFGYILDKKDVYEVMQFTGLYDKNKVPIYEGDIVAEHGHYYNCDKIVYQKVQWKESYSCWLKGEYERLTPKNIEKYRIEVVGNIYENSDLLGE